MLQLRKISADLIIWSFYAGQFEILIIGGDTPSSPVFYAYDKSQKLRQIDKDYFCKVIFGFTYETIDEQLPLEVYQYKMTYNQEGAIYLCAEESQYIYGFDKGGNKILEWDVKVGGGHPICDLKFQSPDFLWLAFPTGQTVAQVSLSEKKETFRIGDYSSEDNGALLSYPESIFVNDNYLFIPNMGNKKLFRVDLATKEIQLITTFHEKIWRYEETKLGVFIQTDKGIYEIEQW